MYTIRATLIIYVAKCVNGFTSIHRKKNLINIYEPLKLFRLLTHDHMLLNS